MMHYTLIGLIAILATCNAAVKMPITVYYESLCPDSAAFITNQIYPAVKEDLRNLVDITWVPYGKSSHTTRGSEVTFNCHHGANECYGNMVHACGINHIQSNSYETQHTRESLTLDFITCLMRSTSIIPYPAERCARENHINNWEVIQNCANGTEGQQLLKKFGEQTMQFQNPLISVPSVVFNYQFDDYVQQKALKDFRGAFCSKVNDPKPHACRLQNGAESVFLAPILAVIAFFLTKLF